MMDRRQWLQRAAAGLAAVASGCSKPAAPSALGPGGKDYIEDLAELLRFAAKDGRRPPAGPNDLTAFEGPAPVATMALANRLVVYPWGKTLATGPQAAATVLAYEAKAETEGGWVLMQDGTVKRLSAEELKAAPRVR